MKRLLILSLSFMVVGCESSPQRAALNAEKATAITMMLANEKAATLYNVQPFMGGQPAQLAGGKWVWMAREGYGHGDVLAIVELALDGSTNHVDLQLFDSEDPRPF